MFLYRTLNSFLHNRSSGVTSIYPFVQFFYKTEFFSCHLKNIFSSFCKIVQRNFGSRFFFPIGDHLVSTQIFTRNYQRARNVTFLENFAYVLNGSSETLESLRMNSDISHDLIFPTTVEFTLFKIF